MSATKDVRVACRMHDWTRALLEGQVPDKSLHIVMTEQENVGVDGLVGDQAKFDYAECGLAGLVQSISKGTPVIGFPAFIRHTFRHSYILIRSDRGINKPKDLEGKRVGTSWNTTATIWIRGLLQDGYDVDFKKINWLDVGPAGYTTPSGANIERAQRGTNLHQMLRDGQLDAIMTFDAEMIHHQGSTTVRRLWDDVRAEEIAWWKRTHLMPFMNVPACDSSRIKNKLDEAREVFEAFVQAKEIGLQALQNNRDSGLAWYWEALETQLDVLGVDPVPYSVSKNQKQIETLLRLCAEQGVTDRQLAVDEVFYAGFDSLTPAH